MMMIFWEFEKLESHKVNLAKLGDGLDESPTVTVGETKSNNLVKIGAYSKPIWAFILYGTSLCAIILSVDQNSFS